VERSFFGDSCEWLFETSEGAKILVKELASPQRVMGKEYFLDYDDSALIPVAESSDEE
jgi:hypothetical protein